MKTLTRALLVVLLISSAVTAHAATCRSGEAAVRGGEAGLARDQDAADTNQTAAQTSSDILGKCVGGITGIFSTTSFPDLSAIWQMIKDKVCSIASSSVNGVISEVNGQINGVMSEVNGAVTDAVNQTGVNDTGLGTVVGSGDTHISNPVEVGHTSDAADSSTNWNEVWK
ncbi:hypothetical protein E8E71_14900 [Pseudomonas sp. BN605]|uniref:hypothetical protein n=1 Tax=Pseudomonas TaxID=286 RepID=UPI002455BDE1|nr:hypothetical protein [Pseudomonas sp. BN605]MDH4845057.1 hypothetical protein [Pseudomonas sp. BN605]